MATSLLTQVLIVVVILTLVLTDATVWSRKALLGGSVALATLVLQSSLAGAMFTFHNAAEIPSSYFKEKREIRAQVVKCVDGDTYRVRHLPFFFSSSEYKGNLADNTIMVRIVAVDTPETAKFGSQGQKYGQVATQFTSDRLLGKTVSVKLYARDQYSRALGSVYFKEGFGIIKKDIAEELLKNGLAVVYRQKGGVHPNGIEYWDYIESRAKKEKKGLWSELNVELPSDYKKKIKQAVKK
jgi:endonuclease YncB( thermonuclease family)